MECPLVQLAGLQTRASARPDARDQAVDRGLNHYVRLSPPGHPVRQATAHPGPEAMWSQPSS